MSKTIYIGGRLESKEKGNVVTGANAILDDTKGKKQNVINKETDDELLRLEQSKQDNLNFDNAPTENSTNPVTSGGVYTAEKALSDAIEAILLLIPSAATALNKLVDTNTMNSSISTATATFRGTYNAVSDLGLTYQATHAQIEAALDALGLTADNNDFAFVQIPVSDQSQDIAKTERFKFNGTNWLYEYDLNTSGFTAAQWAAINSTITLALVQKLAALPTNAELLQALGLKQDVLTFDNQPTTDSNNPVKSGGIKNAIDTAVGDEATARDNADRALSGLIYDEKTRAEGVEGGLDTRLGAVEGSVSTIQGVIPSEATSSNKLVDNSSMTTYIGTIIDNIDATFNVTSTDGHVTLAITQVNGVITSVQLTTSDIASAAALNLKASQADLTALAGRVTTAEGDITSLTGRVTTAEGDITSLTGRVTTAEGDIDQLLALYNALQQSAPQVIQPTDTWPVANPSTTVIYRVIDRVNTPPQYYSDYMWNGTSMVLMATYNNAIDDVPTAGSDNLVKSGGVFANLNIDYLSNTSGVEKGYVSKDGKLSPTPLWNTYSFKYTEGLKSFTVKVWSSLTGSYNLYKAVSFWASDGTFISGLDFNEIPSGVLTTVSVIPPNTATIKISNRISDGTPELYVPIDYFASQTASLAQNILVEHYDSIGNAEFWLDGLSRTFSDMTWVGNRLIGMTSSSDDLETEEGEIHINVYNEGVKGNRSAVYILKHYWGHCNTVDYNQNNDCLILGNGSGAYDLPGKIIVIPNFSSIVNVSESSNTPMSLADVNALVIDCTSYNLGTKFNLVWGDDNDRNYNIAYLITANYGGSTSENGGDLETIRKIVLRKDDEQGDYGSIVTNSTPFNGTFDIVETSYQTTEGYPNCDQGTCYCKGELCAAIGHDGAWYWKMRMNDGVIYRKDYKQKAYPAGSANYGNASGICVKDGYLFFGRYELGVMAIPV